MGGRGSGGSGGGARGGGGAASANAAREAAIERYTRYPAQAPVGTSFQYGDRWYVKVGSNSWTNAPVWNKNATSLLRYTNAELKRIWNYGRR